MNYLLDTLYNNLPSQWVDSNLKKRGKPGEELAVDEAAVWKRVLDYRVVKYLKPKTLLETHAGLSVATDLYKLAYPDVSIVSCMHYQDDILADKKFEYIDIDPFGQPYDAIERCKSVATKDCVWAITNGEILQVCRNLKGVKLKSEYKGKDCWKWVENVYIPYIENETSSHAQFYYIFPSSVRVILSNKLLPDTLWADCPKYMSWISKYANPSLVKLF